MLSANDCVDIWSTLMRVFLGGAPGIGGDAQETRRRSAQSARPCPGKNVQNPNLLSSLTSAPTAAAKGARGSLVRESEIERKARKGGDGRQRQGERRVRRSHLGIAHRRRVQRRIESLSQETRSSHVVDEVPETSNK